MLVKVIKGSGAAWWRDFIGETFEVEDITYSSLSKSHYRLVEGISSHPNAFAIKKDACIVVESDDVQVTNKSLSPVLDKEY